MFAALMITEIVLESLHFKFNQPWKVISTKKYITNV